MKTFIIILLTLFTSCNQSLIEKPKCTLVGSWMWQESSGGSEGQFLPSTKDNIQKIIFKEDGTFQFYQNNKLLKTDEYQISVAKGLTSNDDLDIITFGGVLYSGKVSFNLNGKGLTLFEETPDGFQHNFVKL